MRKLHPNPLVYPFLLVTLAYGLGFVLLEPTNFVSHSSLWHALSMISPTLSVTWGIVALLALALVLVGWYTGSRAAARAGTLLGVAVWFFAALAYILTGGWIVLFSVAIPSIWFWIVSFYAI